MAKPKQHQEKADRNRQFLDSIRKDGQPEWLVIVAFYTDVHLVEKLRAYNNQHSISHEDRNNAVRNNHRKIHTAYHELFNASLVARYATVGKFKMTLEDVNNLFVDGYLTEIEKYVSKVSAKMSK